MKRLILWAMLSIPCIAFSQDTIYHENFDNVLYHTYFLDFPSGFEYDTAGYDLDADDLNDGSNLNPPRPDAWFIAWAFASADSLTPDGDTNFVFAANSWFEPRAQALNYLITPSIYLNDNTGMLSWKSAPYQTPYYCDGYRVLVSTTTNLEDQFTDTLFVAGEYLSTKNPMPDSTFNGYNFSETGFIHGLDGTYTEFNGDSARLRGVLRPFSVSLAQYAGRKIFIAFLHDTDDDNLLSIDDITVTGNGTVDVAEKPATIDVSLYPNPSLGAITLNFDIVQPGAVTLELTDIAGKTLERRALGTLLTGKHTYTLPTEAYAAGSYLLTLHTPSGTKTLKFLIG